MLVLVNLTVLTRLQSCSRSSAILGLSFVPKTFWRENLFTSQIFKSKRQQLPKAIASWMSSYLCVACVRSDWVFSLSDGCLVAECSNSGWNLVCSKLWSFLLLLGVSLGENEVSLEPEIKGVLLLAVPLAVKFWLCRQGMKLEGLTVPEDVAFVL